ncbi:MAG: FxLYD domain-containing protein [Bacteroidia bacterium]|nr:FxLYD domain-containing protein [Bacteroidia bacterium]
MNRKIFYFLVSVLLIALIIFLSDDGNKSTQDNISIEAKSISTHPSGMRFVEPKLRNNTKQSYTNVRIDVLLFDSNKKVLDKFSIETVEIQAGQIWSPKIPTEHNTASEFEILTIHSDQETIER